MKWGAAMDGAPMQLRWSPPGWISRCEIDSGDQSCGKGGGILFTHQAPSLLLWLRDWCHGGLRHRLDRLGRIVIEGSLTKLPRGARMQAAEDV